MFSKFSVVLKCSQHSNFIILRLLNCECRSAVLKRGLLAKNGTNFLLIQKPNISKNNLCFKMACNMSSSSNEGNGQKTGTNDKRKKPNLKALKVPHMNCNRCNTRKQEAPKHETSNAKTISTETSSLQEKKDKGTSKVQVAELKNSSALLQFHFPPKQVHVEYMESQNLKDFNLNKTVPQSYLFNNPKLYLGSRNVKPSNDPTPNVKSNDVLKPVRSSERPRIKKPNLYIQNKETSKDIAIKNGGPKKEITPLNDANTNTVPGSTSNIRILYQGHPRRKTKIRTPKREQTKIKSEDELAQTGEKNQLMPKGTKESKRENSLQTLPPNEVPEKSGEPLREERTKRNIQIKQEEEKNSTSKSKNYGQPFKNEENTGSNTAKTPTKKSVGDINENSKIYFEYLYVLEAIKPMDQSSTAECTLTNANRPKIKILLKSNKRVAAHVEQCLKVHENISKVSKKSHLGSDDGISSLVVLQNLENYFDKYILPEKQIDVKQTSKVDAQVSNTLKDKTQFEKETAVLKADKLSKSRKLCGESQIDSSKGDGSDKNVFQEKRSSSNARRSRFWRTVSVTILSFTLYIIFHIDSIQRVKRMRYIRSTDADPLSLKILPAFYGQSSKSEQINLNDSDSVDDEETESENDSHENKTDSENLKNFDLTF